MAITIHNAKIEEWSKQYSGPKFHAILCDPPYLLEFMGKEWDAPSKASSFPKSGNLGGFADGNKPSFARQKSKAPQMVEVFESWGEALMPHLYPGALVLMFGGTRTWHYLALGMEMAGFEMFDTLMWIYASGFPKAQDLSKLIDAGNGYEREVVAYDASRARPNRTYDGGAIGNLGGTGRPSDRTDNGATITAPSELSAPWSGYKTTALKPAWEPIICFKKPLDGTYAEVAMNYGSGALNVDGGRIDGPPSTGGSISGASALGQNSGWNEHNNRTTEIDRSMLLGRYPANIIFDEEAAELLDEQTGELKSGANPVRRNSDKTDRIYGTFNGHDCFPARGADVGGASRFFYCAKASTAERNAGLEELPDRAFGMSNQAKAEIKRGAEAFDNSNMGVNTVKKVKNHHPTVKPISLAKYLATLILPPASVSPRRLLIPFSGSGSEVIGAAMAGWDEIVGIEQDSEYAAISTARVEHWTKEVPVSSGLELSHATSAPPSRPLQPSLFEIGAD